LEAETTLPGMIDALSTEDIHTPFTGLYVSFDDSTNILSVENTGKRYVEFWMVSPREEKLLTMDSVSVLQLGIQSFLRDWGIETDSIGVRKIPLI